MTVDSKRAVAYVQTELSALSDTDKAAAMQAYMKTEMPFYGVQKPQRTPILRHLIREFPPADPDEYERLVGELWELPHREEKYLAQGVARGFRQFIAPEALPLYRRFIVEGSWWDFVDEAATHMVRPLVVGYPGQTWPTVERWIHDEDMWLRRAAIICQVGAGDHTDAKRLFRFCELRAPEKDFFIRKAIGWALRDHARTDPVAVARFVGEHRNELSGLSYREATRHIADLVIGDRPSS